MSSQCPGFPPCSLVFHSSWLPNQPFDLPRAAEATPPKKSLVQSDVATGRDVMLEMQLAETDPNYPAGP
ncbi:hypothetical protein FZEAL_3109 [Fusarium zealandicum]|uniref:Uncharacterized protein n=1 Tax=Fusarium zealandicum TaxID=1053134 RepID=A0A8H4UPG7_9HYPO|nr:hypothetical protein FZEAL_3109 [Fusarium zealandicum]